VARRAKPEAAEAALQEVTAALAAAGARLELNVPGRAPLAVGAPPARARVLCRTPDALAPLARRDLAGLAEAYLACAIDVEGDFLEAAKIAAVLAPGPTRRARLRLALQALLRDRRRLQRESIAFHYDRPPEFFLPWLERWRSYSHGLYEAPDEPASDAQARKLQRAIDALGLQPGMDVFDMGAGWGAFLEYAGLQGIRVHGVTLSREQHAFCERLIRERGLPCSVELVDFLDYRPPCAFDGAVFMGTLEHFPDYGFAARFLARHLRAPARLWADFCTAEGGHRVGAFLERHVFPGPAAYVRVPRLLGALAREGFHPWLLEDDTRSYALSCRDWADALERERKGLAERFGEPAVRAFQVFLRASELFLATGRTRAAHLVASREPAPLPAPASA
jgi:cyclopropane-fatty-acyl-phospholipid synthase